MRHIKGVWAKNRERIRLEPWQKFPICVVFGWVHRDTGLRRFNTAYLELPRKNAKSTLTAGIANYMLAADDEAGAEVYSLATNKDQARIVFDVARGMALREAGFRNRFGVEVQKHALSVPASASILKALSSADDSLDGLNTHFASLDELHAHKTRAVWDVMETSTGSRTQSLIWAITTAGSNLAGICYEQRSYVVKILTGVSTDETYFGIIYTIDEDDAWDDPRAWAKANPNLGVSVRIEDLERLATKAKSSPSAIANFKTKRLCAWVGAGAPWMDMDAWHAAADPSLRLEDFAGDTEIGGLDLASKKDVASRARMFRRLIDGKYHYYLFLRHYVPAAAIDADDAPDQYSGWSRAGWLTTTPGNIIDIDRIEQDIRADALAGDLHEMGFDPHQATQLCNRLSEDRVTTMVEVRPTVLNFSEPMKELESLVIDGRLHHDGDPVMTWMVSNVVCHYDAKDNVYPRKEHPANKIDGVVATITALARWMAFDGASRTSVYNSRDLVVL
jgi:phage terminase large subunit-like protein